MAVQTRAQARRAAVLHSARQKGMYKSAQLIQNARFVRDAHSMIHGANHWIGVRKSQMKQHMNNRATHMYAPWMEQIRYMTATKRHQQSNLQHYKPALQQAVVDVVNMMH